MNTFIPLIITIDDHLIAISAFIIVPSILLGLFITKLLISFTMITPPNLFNSEDHF
jgi:hypothetical protein